MDNKKLDDFLDPINIPAPEENARKTAMNLAMAEFDQLQQKKNEKNSQGLFSFLRLTDRTNKKQRREKMSFETKKLVYGGMATACVSLIGLTTIFHTHPEIMMPRMDQTTSVSGVVAPGKVAEERAQVTEAYRQSVNERNIQTRSAALKDKEIREKYDGAKREVAAPEPVYQQLAQAQPQKAHEARDDFSAGASIRSRAESEQVVAMQVAPASPTMSRAMPEGKSKKYGFAPGTGGSASGLVAGNMVMAEADADVVNPGYYEDIGRDEFEEFEQNPIHIVADSPVSTFSIDVDTASYSFMRRQLNHGILPQKNAVRIEEMINYFDYDYPLPETREVPFETSVAVVPSPWAEGKKLVHIGIKGYDIAPEEKPRSNLVFLLDVSGSMNNPNKLPLVKQSMNMLLEKLDPEDTVGIVVYAGAAGTVLEPTAVKDKDKIMSALQRLSAGGSTAGAQGIRQAYQLAEANFDKEAVNRVILATDGDFNVGITNQNELKDFVERKRESGIFLSVLGFGQGNLNDHMMQTLAQNGNGVAAYIDSVAEARKVLVEEATSTLFPIAKDVKIQVEFNPETVSEYRLIGYETRALKREDFNNDAVDAGDIGAGHTVTAIYEVTPVGGPNWIDDLRYGKKAQQDQNAVTEIDQESEYAFLKVRYKLPKEDTSKLITQPITAAHDLALLAEGGTELAPWVVRETGWATAVAGFGQLLKGGKYTSNFDYDDVINLAQKNKGADEYGYRSEFIQLVRAAKTAAAMRSQP